VSGLLATERQQRGTRAQARRAGLRWQGVLVLRWFLDGLPPSARGIDARAAAAPGLRGALLAARAAGHPHVTVDGTLIRTDRSRAPGMTTGADRPGRRVDLWWSPSTPPPRRQHPGHRRPGWVALWTSPVRPGREQDTTALRAHPEVLLLTEWTDAEHATEHPARLNP
jgi:hypothetical protein